MNKQKTISKIDVDTLNMINFKKIEVKLGLKTRDETLRFFTSPSFKSRLAQFNCEYAEKIKGEILEIEKTLL